MKITSYSLLIILLLSPLVNIINFDKRFFDWQEYYIYISIVAFFIINCFYRILSKKNLAVRFNIIDLLVVTFLVWFFVRFYFTDIFAFENEIFIKLSVCILLYVSVRSSQINLSGAINFLYAFLPLFSILICVYGILQFLSIIPSNNLFFKMTGLFDNPSTFTNFLCLIFPVILVGYWNASTYKNNWIKILSLISIYLMITTALLGNERAALLAFIAGLILVFNKKYKLFQLLKKSGTTGRVKYYVICSVGAISAGGFYLLYLIRPESFAGRWLIYKNTLNIIKDHPLWGIGPGKFESVYNLYQSQYFSGHHGVGPESRIADNVDVAFNDFLQIFCETGIVGFFCLIVGVIILIRIYRTNSWEKSSSNLGLISSILAIFTAALFSYPLQNFVIMVYLVIIIGLVSKNVETRAVFPQITFNKYVYVLVGFIYAGILIGILFNLSKNQLKWENIANSNQESGTSLQQYQELYPALKDNGYFLYNYGSEMAFDKNYPEGKYVLRRARKYLMDPDVLIYSGDCYLGLKDYKKAEEEYLAAYYMVPKKLLPQYALMQYYHAIKDDNKANAFAEKIIKAVPVAYSEDELEMKQQAVQYLAKNCN
jgi:O-antigen polymerase